MRTLRLLFILACATALWGCNKNKNNTGNLVGAFNNPTVASNCQAGQIRTADGQCLNQYGCPSGQGWNGTTCVPGTVVAPGQVYGGVPSAYASSLQVTDRNTFEAFLERVGGVCNFSNFFSFSLFGPDPYDCSTYSSRGYITMEFYPQASAFTQGGNVPAYVEIGAGVTSPGDLIFGGGYAVDVPLNMVAFPINNTTGFDLRVDGGFFYGQDATVSVRSDSGMFGTDDHFTVSLSYNGREFARSYVSRQ